MASKSATLRRRRERIKPSVRRHKAKYARAQRKLKRAKKQESQGLLPRDERTGRFVSLRSLRERARRLFQIALGS